jgi:hypothetical protein
VHDEGPEKSDAVGKEDQSERNTPFSIACQTLVMQSGIHVKFSLLQERTEPSPVDTPGMARSQIAVVTEVTKTSVACSTVS